MAHSCNVCGKSFSKDYHLHGHRVDSKLETCRKCLYCSYSFLNKSSEQIRNHMRSTHLDYPCGICSRKFFFNDSLTDHVRDARRGAHGGAARQLQTTLNTCFLSDLQSCGNNLKRLLDEKVRLDPVKKKRCNEIIDYLVTFMEHNLGSWFEVSKVVKGGSLGKGTSIKEKVDIDLVVFMKRFKSVADLQLQHKEVLYRLKRHILRDFNFAKQLHYQYDTNHSNRFSLRTEDDTDLIEVDLLPACDIGGGSESVFDEMEPLDEEARSYYSVSFVQDQVNFTKSAPESVKDVIRLVKHWKTREKLNISSYVVEIITIKDWKQMGSTDRADLDQLFKRVMTKLSTFGSIKITWPNNRYAGDRPIVMDPANPFNNTVSDIDRSDQMDIERKAKEIVSRL